MFFCQFCDDFKTTELKVHLEHRVNHHNLSNKFSCGYNKCLELFDIEVSLRSHLIRVHNLKLKQPTETVIFQNVVNEDAKYICSLDICRKEMSNYNSLIKHLKTHLNERIKVKCPFKNCEKTYENVSSFTAHLSKQHKSVKQESWNLDARSDKLGSVNNIESQKKVVKGSVDSVNVNCSKSVCVKDSHQNSTDLFLSNVAQFYLKLECEFHVPVSTIQYIVSGVYTTHEQSQDQIKINLREGLLDQGLESNVVEKILFKTFESDMFSKSYDTFKTDYKRKKFYKDRFNYVEPKQCFLDRVNGKDIYFHYVPIEETIKATYKDKSVAHELSHHVQQNNLLKDFTDGTIVKNNKILNENPDAAMIILYQDSFEVVNPIGPARKRHKLLAVYLSIGNLPDHLRSHINNIKLVALCKEKYFNHKKVYGRIVQCLKVIETDGIQIEIGKSIKGTLVFIVGDNLGSHSLGGFLENFSKSTYFCRYCLITRTEFYEKDGALKVYPTRTVNSYNESIEKIKKNKSLVSHEGIKNDSVFNELLSFHVCNPGLPPCLGHDLFEGVVAYDLKLYVDYFVKNKWFSISGLNNLIELFPYSSEDLKDKPCPIDVNSYRIQGGACQVWQFLRLFPIIIENKIKDPYDEVWYLVLLLTEIVEITCAPIIDKSCLPYFQNLINEYLAFRSILFEEKLRPKHHYMHHYPSLIEVFGPLMKVWSLRFESKHTFFKEIIRNIRNFINLTKSLSEKHELFQSLIRLGADWRTLIEVHDLSRLNLPIYTEKIQKVIRKINVKLNFQECNEVIFKGTLYKKGDAVVFNQTAYQYNIEIGIICLLLCDDEKNVYFVLQIVKSSFRAYCRLYELGHTLKYECLSLNQMISHEPLHIYNIANINCIKPKFGFVSKNL